MKPEDIKRIAKACGGQVVVTMADMEGEGKYNKFFYVNNLIKKHCTK